MLIRGESKRALVNVCLYVCVCAFLCGLFFTRTHIPNAWATLIEIWHTKLNITRIEISLCVMVCAKQSGLLDLNWFVKCKNKQTQIRVKK